MPRRSRSRSPGFGTARGGFFGGRSSFTNARPAPARPQPTVGRSSGIFSGIGSTLAHGMAFGAGSSIAHQAIRSIMGPSYQPVYIQQAPAPGQSYEQFQAQQAQQIRQSQQQICLDQINQFAQCIEKNNDNIGSCQNFSNALKQCKKRHQNK